MAIRTIERPAETYENHGVYWVERPLPQHEDDDARWAEFCRTIVDRINEERAEQTDPICKTCGSTTPEIVNKKWCWGCQSNLILDRFASDRSRRDGRRPICKTCDNGYGKRYRARLARQAVSA